MLHIVLHVVLSCCADSKQADSCNDTISSCSIGKAFALAIAPPTSVTKEVAATMLVDTDVVWAGLAGTTA